MVGRYREKTTLTSNCRATFCGKFNVHLHRVGWFAAKCGVKERIAAPMTRDHPGLGAGSEGLAVPVGRGSWRARQGPADFSGVRLMSGGRPTEVRPGIPSEDSIMSEKSTLS